MNPQTAEPEVSPMSSAVRDFQFSSTDSTNLMSADPMNSMKGPNTMQNANKFFPIIAIIAIIGGSLTGLGIGKLSAKGNGVDPSAAASASQVVATVAKDSSSLKNGQVFGSANTDSFKDSAEGYLEAGGINGEGTHHLLRDGGMSQTVYLNSSVTDLSKFEKMKVKVWGDTNKAQSAGWLMDVGRVQVEDTQAQPPASK